MEKKVTELIYQMIANMDVIVLVNYTLLEEQVPKIPVDFISKNAL